MALKKEYDGNNNFRAFMTLSSYPDGESSTAHMIALIFDFKNNKIKLFDTNYLYTTLKIIDNTYTFINKLKSKLKSNVVGKDNYIKNYEVIFDMDFSNPQLCDEIMHKIYRSFKGVFPKCLKSNYVGENLDVRMQIIVNKDAQVGNLSMHLNELNSKFIEDDKNLEKIDDNIRNTGQANGKYLYHNIILDYFNLGQIEIKENILKKFQIHGLNPFDSGALNLSRIFEFHNFDQVIELLNNSEFKKALADTTTETFNQNIFQLFFVADVNQQQYTRQNCLNLDELDPKQNEKLSAVLSALKVKINPYDKVFEDHSLISFVVMSSSDEKVKIFFDTFKDKINPYDKVFGDHSLISIAVRLLSDEKAKIFFDTFKDKINPYDKVSEDLNLIDYMGATFTSDKKREIISDILKRAN